MDGPGQASSSRVLSLVQYCQRVAILHADSLCGVGDNVAFDLIKPILDHCSAATLMRVEDASPNLHQDTDELWRGLCVKDLPLDASKYLEGTDSPTHGWRQVYEDLQVARAKKLEEAESRLRSSRLDEELKRKERDVKLAEAPPMKRARPWGTPVQPKTLFQKTRTEATKTQRLFTSQSRPPMLAAKAYRSSSSVPSSGKLTLTASSSTAASTSTSKVNPRVVVRSVALPIPTPEQNPSSVPAFPPSLASSATTQRLPASAAKSNPRVVVRPMSLPIQQTPAATPSTTPLSIQTSESSHAEGVLDSDNTRYSPQSPVAVASPRPMRPLPNTKRSLGSLFMPKHRSYNQLLDRSQVSPPR